MSRSRIVIEPTPAEFPLGERGARPVLFYLNEAEAASVKSWSIPGVETTKRSARAPWDAALLLASYLGLPLPKPPVDAQPPLPGAHLYARRYEDKARAFHPLGIAFLARRAYAILADAPRAGKTFQSIIASELVGTRHAFVGCPAVVKRNWAEEIYKWTGEAALMLYGRSGYEVRRFCVACEGRGYVPARLAWTKWGHKMHHRLGHAERDTDEPPRWRFNVAGRRIATAPKYADGAARTRMNLLASRARRVDTNDALRCKTCFGRGSIVLPVKIAAPQPEALVVTQPAGGPFDRPVEGPGCVWPPRRSACRRHQGAVTAFTPLCPACLDELYAEIDKARWLIGNYDILVPQQAERNDGSSILRRGLMGWVPTLSAMKPFDLGILDEAHYLRGRDFRTVVKDRTARSARVYDLLKPTPRVWELTATPIYTHLIDIWNLLNIASRGLWSTKPFQFGARYCGASHGEWGWEDEGTSLYGETELPARLKLLMLQRTRAEIAPHMPPKDRQVIRIDIDAAKSAKAAFRGWTPGQGTQRLIEAIIEVGDLKRPYIVEEVIDQMMTGARVIVTTFHVESMKRMAQAIQLAVDKEPRLRKLNTKIWAIHGELGDARTDLARGFREHCGPGAWVTTVDGTPGGISLRGAVEVHHQDFHWSPEALQQCEDRGFELDVSGYVVRHYTACGSVDDMLEAKLMPKLAMLQAVLNSQFAAGVGSALALSKRDPERDLDDVIARLTAHLEDDDDDD